MNVELCYEKCFSWTVLQDAVTAFYRRWKSFKLSCNKIIGVPDNFFAAKFSFIIPKQEQIPPSLNIAFFCTITTSVYKNFYNYFLFLHKNKCLKPLTINVIATQQVSTRVLCCKFQFDEMFFTRRCFNWILSRWFNLPWFC